MYLTPPSIQQMGIRMVGLVGQQMTTGVQRQVKGRFIYQGLEKGTGGRITHHSITDHLLTQEGFRLKSETGLHLTLMGLGGLSW